MAGRSTALDVFRGVTIAGMILVNYAGPLDAAPAPLKHSAWDGFTPTDLVFPSFLFIVGVAMWFAFDRAQSRPLAAKIAKRSAFLFAVGVAINAFPFVGVDYATVTIMGVLQRIALCYGIASLLCLTLRPAPLVAVCVAILVGYWALLAATGGTSIDASLPGRVDRAVFGASHLNPSYVPPFEPEGLLGTLPSVVNVICGYLAGRWISGADPARAVRGLIVVALPLVAIALVWDRAFPINKPLWTSSYAVLTVGLALAMLGVAIWLADIRGYRPAVFVALGRRPLTIYVIATLAKGALAYFGIYEWMHDTAFAPVFGTSLGAVVLALVWVAVYAALALRLARSRAA